MKMVSMARLRSRTALVALPSVLCAAGIGASCAIVFFGDPVSLPGIRDRRVPSAWIGFSLRASSWIASTWSSPCAIDGMTGISAATWDDERKAALWLCPPVCLADFPVPRGLLNTPRDIGFVSARVSGLAGWSPAVGDEDAASD